MPRGLDRVTIGVNRYAFHWAYPEIAADELGLFAREGISISWNDATPNAPTNKTEMYRDLLETGKTDVYHAGEWACINRVLGAPESRIIAKSTPARDTLNSTFSLYARPESSLKSPKDLGGRTVAIEKGTGSYFTALLDLERYIPMDSIRLVEMGEPHKRFVSLLCGEVDVASLVGPWVDAAEFIGLRRLLVTSRKTPTTMVVSKSMEIPVLKGFFRALNSAIRKIDRHPGLFRESYFRRVQPIIKEMPAEIASSLEGLDKRIKVSKWKAWEPYGDADFRPTYAWMVERNLASPGRRSSDIVDARSSRVFNLPGSN